MSKLESFLDLGKKQEELTNKDFYFGSNFLATLTLASENSKFHSRIGINEPQASYPVFASAWQEIKVGSYVFKGKKISDGGLKLGISHYPISYPELKVNFNYVQVIDSSNIGIEYSSSNLNINLKCKSESFDLSGNVGTDKYGVGAQISSQIEKLFPSSCQLGCWHQGPTHKFLLKHQIQFPNHSPGITSLSIFQVQKSLTLGCYSKFNWLDNTFDLTMSIKYPLDTKTWLKSRITKDKLSLVLINQLSSQISTSIQSELDLESSLINSISNLHFGFRINIST